MSSVRRRLNSACHGTGSTWTWSHHTKVCQVAPTHRPGFGPGACGCAPMLAPCAPDVESDSRGVGRSDTPTGTATSRGDEGPGRAFREQASRRVEVPRIQVPDPVARAPPAGRRLGDPDRRPRAIHRGETYRPARGAPPPDRPRRCAQAVPTAPGQRGRIWRCDSSRSDHPCWTRVPRAAPAPNASDQP
jgi:hypothetical protein